MPDCENYELSSDCLWCAVDTNSVKIKIAEQIRQKLISAVEITELMHCLLTSNQEEDKALLHTLNPESHSRIRVGND